MTPSLLSLLSRDLSTLWLLLKTRTDEIMHHDISPLCAADIRDQLQKRFAYLSGGRGQDGSPVITFPDYPAFSDVPDQDFQNVMTYLTSIPSLQDAGIGFILVIDRRQDRWTSVKASILRIASHDQVRFSAVILSLVALAATWRPSSLQTVAAFQGGRAAALRRWALFLAAG
ncbi:hypothetical protein MG293_011288 [Ovis ammon polii]|uniref:MCF2L n=1 Tax=Ovis ammon polii TaxID=230172 RepID=A0AAD4YA68_OVIAM|nr:hypothetical protein MG293_011288 [Ovis ammon polii]KAI4565427.1 hypothetical protein MJT46_009770 [Ovis ammon polii x Ovis aries]